MKALYITEPGKVEIREIPKPEPKSDEVLLRVKFVGLCGTDLSTYRGKNPLAQTPRIPGHEISGIIAAKGADVPEQFYEGQNVTLSPYTNCGECPSCRRNRPNACQFNQTLGVQREGAMAEYITVPWHKLYSSTSLSLKDLALVEPMTVGSHAADRGEIVKGDTVVVIGCGAIGIGIVASATWRGARVIAVDVNDTKLKMATRAGATDVINTTREDLHAVLSKLTLGGPDVVVEAIGLSNTFIAAVDEVAFTGRVVYIGYTKESVSYKASLFVQKELDIRGTRNATAQDFETVIKMLEAEYFPARDLITHIVPLEKVAEALREWDSNPELVTRILVSF